MNINMATNHCCVYAHGLVCLGKKYKNQWVLQLNWLEFPPIFPANLGLRDPG